MGILIPVIRRLLVNRVPDLRWSLIMVLTSSFHCCTSTYFHESYSIFKFRYVAFAWSKVHNYIERDMPLGIITINILYYYNCHEHIFHIMNFLKAIRIKIQRSVLVSILIFLKKMALNISLSCLDHDWRIELKCQLQIDASVHTETLCQRNCPW